MAGRGSESTTGAVCGRNVERVGPMSGRMSDPVSLSSPSFVIEPSRLDAGIRAGAGEPGSPFQRPSIEGPSFREVLSAAARRIGEDGEELERWMGGGRGRASAPPDAEGLLAAQATVYRYSQEVELAAKLVDKLTGAVRQVVSSPQ